MAEVKTIEARVEEEYDEYDPNFADSVLELDLGTPQERALAIAKKYGHEPEAKARLENQTYRNAPDLRTLLAETCKKKKVKPINWGKLARKLAKITGIVALLAPVGYGVSRIPSVRVMYDSEYNVKYQQEIQKQEEEQKREEHRKQVLNKLYAVANINCIPGVRMSEFLVFYEETTGKGFPNQSLKDYEVRFGVFDVATTAIKIEFNGTDKYNISLSTTTAEQLIQKANANPCLIPTK
ncbi:MAG: hypothetical protein AABW48_05790 [Nanoarchaeota archaeon]